MAKMKATPKRKTAPAPTLYVAVVVSDDAEADDFCSLREYGDWACFVNTNKAQAITDACDAARAWSKIDAKYHVIVGTITEMVKETRSIAVRSLTLSRKRG